VSQHILVVDDEPGMRETLVDIFEAAGYRVTAVNNGSAAVRLVREDGVNVVVMDVRMPGLDGVETMREMDAPPPQVIVMTAYAVEERLRAAISAHAFAVVHKPFAVARMLSLVADAAALVA
jgi:two-component system, response regulator, stage 0 sporulation protein F